MQAILAMSIASGARSVIRRLQGERRSQRTGGRRTTDREPNRGWIPVLAFAIPIALADWTVKWLVVHNVPLYDFRLLWPDHVAIWHVTNPALVLGLHGDLPLFVRKGLVSVYAILSVIFLIAVLGRGHRLLPHRRKWVWLFLGMVLGGMIGNLGERLFHWGVTDYLSLRWGDLWLPPGNIADLSILLSLPISVAVLAFEMEARALRGASVTEHARSASAAEAGTPPPLEA
jgi:signal peptidase II